MLTFNAEQHAADDRLSCFFSDVIALRQNGECPAGSTTSRASWLKAGTGMPAWDRLRIPVWADCNSVISGGI